MASMNTRRWILYLALIAVLLPIIFNEWILERAFSSDSDIEDSNKRIIRVFDLALLLSAFFFYLLYRSEPLRAFCMRLFSRFENFFAFLVGCMMAGLLVILAEMVFFFIQFFNYDPSEAYYDFYIVNKEEISLPDQDASLLRKGNMKDELLGYKPIANAIIRSVKGNGKDTIFDVIYTIDEFNRRLVPGSEDGSLRAFLFFGGSFAFGQGVNGNENLPAALLRLLPNYAMYNYSYLGYGPSQMLAKFESNELDNELSQRNVKVIYTFINSHIPRTIGSMNQYNNWMEDFPNYEFDKNGKIFRNGSFTSGRPFTAKLYGLLGKSYILRRIGFNWPLSFNSYHYKLTADVINRSYELYKEQFESDGFYILFYAGTKEARNLIPLLSEGIRIIDQSELLDTTLPKYGLEGDGHPTPLCFELSTKEFYKMID